MGTRSLTYVRGGFPGEDPKTHIVMYRQFDGYPEGHGIELAEFLDGIDVVNGIAPGETEKIANGTGCLAAQIVAHFKTEPGGIYLDPPEKDRREEVNYDVVVTEPQLGQRTVQEKDPGVLITVTDFEGKQLLRGTPAELLSQIKGLDRT